MARRHKARQLEHGRMIALDPRVNFAAERGPSCADLEIPFSAANPRSRKIRWPNSDQEACIAIVPMEAREAEIDPFARPRLDRGSLRVRAVDARERHRRASAAAERK